MDGRNDNIITDYHMLVRRLYTHALVAHNSIHLSVSFQPFQIFCVLLWTDNWTEN